MNVKKIVVDELPEDGCSECCFSKVFTSKFGNDKVRCVATNKSVSDFAFGYTKQPRPSWCPLVVDECCEWGILDAENGMYGINCEYMGMIHIDFHYTFCPMCGKPIKYVEVE